MRNLKFWSPLAAGIVVFLGASLLGVWLLVNPNHYKGNIAAAVKQATGRELKLTGDLKLSVFPWIALELGPASLGNPPGFSDEPFLSFTHATVRVKLLPLLRKRLEVARVEIDGLDVRLRKNAAGRGNWQDADRNPTQADASHRDPSRAIEAFANVRVQNGRLSYENTTIENLKLETGSVATHGEIPVSVALDGHRGTPREQVSMIAKFDLSEDAASEQWLLTAVNLSGTRVRAGEGRPVHWDLAAPELRVSPAQLAVPEFTMSYAGAHLNGSVAATRILDELSMAGSVIVAPLVLREFASQLGMTLPKTRDAKALSTLSATTDFTYDSAALTLRKLQLRLDDTVLQGSFKLQTGETAAMEFDLTADQIDLDRYRAPEGGAAEHEPRAVEQVAKRAMPLNAHGTFNLKSAHFARIDLSDLRIQLSAKDDVTRLFPIEAQVDGGRYTGDITWDSRGTVPMLSVDEHLMGVDMARLLANGAQKGRLSGQATLNLKATARGASVSALLNTLIGHLDANLADGAFAGIDVGYELGRAQGLLDRSPAPPRGNTGHTQFEAFKTSAQITNGIAETHDLTIASRELKVTGQGSANLSSKVIDFQLLAAILTAPENTLNIPLKITGTYSDPTVRPDIQAVAKDQLKQKLQDVLKKNGLQGLFGK